MENLGKLAKDKITGFEGTITGYCQYLTGCDQYLISHKVDKEGKSVEGLWIDVNRLNISKKTVIKLNTKKEKGAMDQPPIKN